MKNKKIWYLVISTLVVIIGLFLFNEGNLINENTNQVNNVHETKPKEDNLDFQIHFIDVGQGDCALIKSKDKTMLIDAGTNKSEEELIKYLETQNIEKFDYIIATHPHEDHIGGMDKVISNFDVDKIIAPKVTTTTKTFENFVNSVKAKDKKVTNPNVGEKFELADAKFEIYAPNSNEYDELNNYSIVIRVVYKNNSFLFTGDAESISEKEILNNSNMLKSDLLKVGHHGSSSSTTANFLNRVNPKYAVISVGKDNSYNHPTKTVMNRLKAKNISVYRTDELGTIIVSSDGNNISFNKERGSYNYMQKGKVYEN